MFYIVNGKIFDLGIDNSGNFKCFNKYVDTCIGDYCIGIYCLERRSRGKKK